MAARGEPRLLRRRGATVRRGSRRVVPRQLGRGAPRRARAPRTARGAVDCRRDEPRAALPLEVPRLRRPAARPPARRRPTRSGHRPAARHLVLHVPGDVLRDRRLPRRLEPPAQPARRGALRHALPSARSGADRPLRDGGGGDPRAPGELGGLLRGRLPVRRGLREEDAAREPARSRRRLGLRRCGLDPRHRRRRPDVCVDGVARRRRVRASDLLRLLGLLGHGDRHGPDVRLSLPRELPPPLRVAIRLGVLATVARLDGNVVPGLRLLPARREPRADPRPAAPQPARRLVPHRSLARRRLDVRLLGADVLRTHHCGEDPRLPPRRPRPYPRDARTALCGLFRSVRLGALPGRFVRRRRTISGRDVRTGRPGPARPRLPTPAPGERTPPGGGSPPKPPRRARAGAPRRGTRRAERRV